MNNLIIPLSLLTIIILLVALSNKKQSQASLIINENTWRWIKIIIAIATLYIAYLFALNGRYTDHREFITKEEIEYRDKWKIR